MGYFLSFFLPLFYISQLKTAREHQPGTSNFRQGSRFFFRQFATWEFCPIVSLLPFDISHHVPQRQPLIATLGKLDIRTPGGRAILTCPRRPHVLRALKRARPSCDALHSTPLAEVLLHRHRATRRPRAPRAPCWNAIFTGPTTPTRPAEPRRGFARRGRRRRGARDRARRNRVQQALQRRGRARALAQGPPCVF